mgnify:CR=1 FL=1
MKTSIRFYNDHEVRAIWDEEKSQWFFSVLDIAGYKRVIRLDQKIQIIIDGNRKNVEQGKDARGKFYKVYYQQEM